MTLDKNLLLHADEIFKEFIYDDLRKKITINKNPFVYILGGQPGAGKSMLTKLLLNNFSDNAMVINADDFRKFHPQASELYTRYGEDASRFTGEFSGYITEKAINQASNDGYSLIIEGTFRTAEIPLRTLQGLQEKGYRTGVAIITTAAEKSWQSVNQRYEKQLEKSLQARMTPRSHHDLVIDNLAKNADTVYQDGNVYEFLVFNREEKLFDSKQNNDLPGKYINEELNSIKLNVLSNENEKIMRIFKERLQEMRPDMPFSAKEETILKFREQLLDLQIKNKKSLNKIIDKEFEL